MATLLNGKEVAQQLQAELAATAKSLPYTPTLAVVLVGSNPASQIYVANKKKACAAVGFASVECLLDEAAGQAALLACIQSLNAREDVHGILCQLPLPQGYGYDAAEVARSILPSKDVDAFHPQTVGQLTLGQPSLLPCTPHGILRLLQHYNLPLAGQHVVVVGRSNIVGKPMALLALQHNATVTVCHSKTQNLSNFTRQADILIAAVGIPNFITANRVKSGAVVIDVGMNRLPDQTLCGDVAFHEVAAIASHITPVPGGVGPMTIAELLHNTLTAAQAAHI